MAIEDRRSGRDRRNLERFKVNIEVEWEGLVGRKLGIISDISPLGCFILCSGEVEDTERIALRDALDAVSTVGERRLQIDEKQQLRQRHYPLLPNSDWNQSLTPDPESRGAQSVRWRGSEPVINGSIRELGQPSPVR